MKILLTLVTTIALTSAASIDNKYDMHYSQHQSSVDSARNSMQERLSKLESQQRQYSSGGSENYAAGCSSCVGSGSTYNSRSASSSSSSQHNSRSSSALASDYVGVGIVGHAADGQVAGRFSNAYEQEDLQQRVVPGDLNSIQASAYRASETEHDENDVQRTVGVGYRDAAVNNDGYSYSQRRQQQQLQEQKESESRTVTGRLVPVYYMPGGTSSISSSQRHASGSESQLQEVRSGQAVPINNFVSMAVRPGTATLLQVPVRVSNVPASRDHSTSSRSEYASSSEASSTRVQPGYRVNYYPTSSTYTASSADRSRSESDLNRISTSHQQPEKYTNPDLSNYNSYNSLDSTSRSRYNSYEGSQVQERVSPTIDSTSSSSSVRGGAYTGTRVVPAFPVHTIESISSQKTAEEREQRRYTPSRPVFVASSRVSENDESRNNYGRTSYTSRTSTGEGSSSSQYGSSGSTYYVAPSTSRNSLQSQSQYQGQSQHQAGSGYMRTAYGGYLRPGQLSTSSQGAASSLSSSQLSSRFGSGVQAAGSDDLNQYMSESERLARAQQQQIAGSSHGSSVISNVDEANRRTVNTAQHLDAAAASFVSGTNQAQINNALDTIETLPGSGTGGYQRVKSWSKQSKWASGSEYDSDGKIKSHAMLSTGESERHNVNGKEAGYKAATTTLENDGKVSTYSIHTP